MILLRYLKRLNSLVFDKFHETLHYSSTSKYILGTISIFCCYSEVMITFAAFYFYMYSKAVKYDKNETLELELQGYDQCGFVGESGQVTDTKWKTYFLVNGILFLCSLLGSNATILCIPIAMNMMSLKPLFFTWCCNVLVFPACAIAISAAGRFSKEGIACAE